MSLKVDGTARTSPRAVLAARSQNVEAIAMGAVTGLRWVRAVASSLMALCVYASCYGVLSDGSLAANGSFMRLEIDDKPRNGQNYL